MILHDNETRVDFLNNEAIAKTIVELLKEKPDSPLTVGVHGDWGAGKSSVLEMIESRLSQDESVLCLKFNGWRFQGFEDAKIALIEGIVSGLVEKKPALRVIGDKVKGIFSRINWLKIAKKTGGLALTAVTGVPSPDQVMSAVSFLQGLVVDPNNFTVDNISKIISEVKDVIDPASDAKNVPTEIAEFQREFSGLLEAAGVSQLIVLIDDLDRCLPETAIETLEAVRLFLFAEKTAFVVAADESMIEYAVRRHFPDLPESSNSQAYARNYLEKLIQVPFRIPSLGNLETRVYVSLLLTGVEVGEESPEFLNLLDVAREKLKQPWLNDGLDAGVVKSVLGDKFQHAAKAFHLSEQIGPILASGTRGNPRQIKRFLNTLILREKSASARGFGDEVKLPVLAKLMLAERFLPKVFDQIANAAANDDSGFCGFLKEIENVVCSGKVDEATDNSEIINEFIKTQSIVEWIRVEPLIGDIDLRPYLFIAKDKKDYFGASTSLGHLVALVDRLMESKYQVDAMQDELKKLTVHEAEEIFEGLVQKIKQIGDYQNKPRGIDGMIALVKSHEALSDNLVNFLGTLPVESLGVWVCRGWAPINTPAYQAKFKALLQSWIDTGQPMLSAAAQQILKA